MPWIWCVSLPLTVLWFKYCCSIPDILGSRLEFERSGDLASNAALCYICAGNVDKLVSWWNRFNGSQSPTALQVSGWRGCTLYVILWLTCFGIFRGCLKCYHKGKKESYLWICKNAVYGWSNFVNPIKNCWEQKRQYHMVSSLEFHLINIHLIQLTPLILDLLGAQDSWARDKWGFPLSPTFRQCRITSNFLLPV